MSGINEDLIEYGYVQDEISWRLMLRTRSGYVQVFRQFVDSEENTKNKLELHALNMKAALDYVFWSYDRPNDARIDEGCLTLV